MKRIAWLPCAAALLAACTPPPAPAPVPEEGRYEYTGRYLAPGQAQPHEFRGFLVVTALTPERLDGTWLVTGFQPSVQLGTFLDGAYEVGADVEHQGLRGSFKHRLVPAAGGGWTCTAVFVARVDGVPVSNPATCVLARPNS
jgi:hypothetical protein